MAWGALLATSCGGSAADPNQNPSDAATDATGDAPTDGGRDSGMDAPAEGGLPTVPYPETLECRGPTYDGGYWGRCCDRALCREPENGTCPPPERAYEIPGFPPGSGSCECEPARGPFAPRSPATEAACCYLVGSIGCEGRPLRVRGRPRRAHLGGAVAWCRLTVA